MTFLKFIYFSLGAAQNLWKAFPKIEKLIKEEKGNFNKVQLSS